MGNNILKNVKGTFDSLPNEQILKNEIINKLRDNFELYGYLPLETTILCTYDLLASKYAGGAEILKEMYTLKDQGNRDIGLRYDLTVPFSKIIAMNANKDISLPFRRYEIGKVFRDGPVKLGRNREFYQCDVDLCGISGTYPEIEIMLMVSKCYKDLGIDVRIEWNNRKLLSGLIQECGIEEDLVSRVILSVDKLAKIGEEGVINELLDYNVSKEKLEQLFSYFKENINSLVTKFENTTNEILKEGLTEVEELSKYIEKFNLNEYEFTPYLARGLEIYTGTIWEVFDKEGRITSSLGGGGRYDKIITNFIDDGNSYPAVGISFGLVPIYEILSKKETNKSMYDIYIIPMDTNFESLNFAESLRKNGIKAIVEMNNKKVKKAFEWANKNNIPFVTVIGENEINTGNIKIKDMNKSKEIEININDIDNIVKIIKEEA